MFLESLHIDILIFWYLKSVRCKKSCISVLFQHRAIALHYKGWTLLCTLWRMQTPHTCIRHHSDDLRHHRSLDRRPTNANRFQQTPKEVNRHCESMTQTPSNSIFVCLGMSDCLMVQLCVCWRLVLSGDGCKVSGEGAWGHLSDVNGCLWDLHESLAVSESSVLVW